MKSLQALDELNKRYEKIAAQIARLEGVEKEVKRNLEQVKKEAISNFGTADIEKLREMAISLQREIEQQSMLTRHKIHEAEQIMNEIEQMINKAYSGELL